MLKSSENDILKPRRGEFLKNAGKERLFMYDLREGLKPGSEVEIDGLPVTISKYRDCGGSCIVYDGIYNGERVIIKEFYPVSLGLKRREGSNELNISCDIEKDFNEQKERYIKGAEAFARFSFNNRDYVTERIIGKGEANNTYYYFSYTDEGSPLKSIYDGRADFSLEKVMRIMRGICTVISKIHKEGNLYLDLKPSNIWYDDPSYDDNIYIRLFDFDTVISKKELKERDDFVPGSTLGYAADELIYNLKDQISYCTDVYAIGMVFYWLLTGEDVSSKSVDDITLDDSWMNESGCLIYVNRAKDDKKNREIKEAVLNTLKELLKNENRFKPEIDNCDSVLYVIRTKFENLQTLIMGANYKYDIKKDIIEGIDKIVTDVKDEIKETVKEGKEKLKKAQIEIKADQEKTNALLDETRSNNLELKELMLEKHDMLYSLLQSALMPSLKTDSSEKKKAYSYEDDISFPVFNSVYDHPEFGDERAFIHIREIGDAKWHRNIKLSAGKKYEVDILFRNDASDRYNGSDCDNRSVALETNMSIDLPKYILPDQKDGLTVRITSDNSVQSCEDYIELVTDEQKLHLTYVLGTCKMKNNWKMNNEILPEKIFRPTKGLYIGLNDLNGVIPGGDEYSGHISFIFDASLQYMPSSYNADIITDSKADWEPKERNIYSRHRLPEYATFNSVVDDLQFGDERFFVRIADLGDNPPLDYLDNHPETVFQSSMEIVPGRTYAVKIIAHNNPSVEMNYPEQKSVGMALDFRVRSSFVKKISSENDGFIMAEVHSTTAKPKCVSAKAGLSTKSSAVVNLEYVNGSAIIHNSGKLNGTILASEFLFSERGIYLGYNKLIGNIPSGNEYACYVTYLIRATQVGSKVRKYVSNDGKVFKKNVSVSAGDVLTYKIEFLNTGSEDIPRVVFHDKFPACLELISGSIMLINNANPDGIKMNDSIDKNGFNTGLYGPGAFATITYKARIIGSPAKYDTSGKKIYYENSSFVDHDFGEITDKATFTIK